MKKNLILIFALFLLSACPLLPSAQALVFFGEDLNFSQDINNTGSVFYFGFIDAANPFTKVTFLNTNPGSNDGFGYDDLTIGRVENVVETAVPEPATLTLIMLGGLGAAFSGRKRFLKNQTRVPVLSLLFSWIKVAMNRVKFFGVFSEPNSTGALPHPCRLIQTTINCSNFCSSGFPHVVRIE